MMKRYSVLTRNPGYENYLVLEICSNFYIVALFWKIIYKRKYGYAEIRDRNRIISQ